AISDSRRSSDRLCEHREGRAGAKPIGARGEDLQIFAARLDPLDELEADARFADACWSQDQNGPCDRLFDTFREKRLERDELALAPDTSCRLSEQRSSSGDRFDRSAQAGAAAVINDVEARTFEQIRARAIESNVAGVGIGERAGGAVDHFS